MTAVVERVPVVESTGPDLESRLRQELRGEVQFDDYTRHLFSRDASMYSIMPRGVVFPLDADDVAATVRIAREFGVTVTPRGAGTSLAGQTIGDGIVLDLSLAGTLSGVQMGLHLAGVPVKGSGVDAALELLRQP